jgi:hypothetical protein
VLPWLGVADLRMTRWDKRARSFHNQPRTNQANTHQAYIHTHTYTLTYVRVRARTHTHAHQTNAFHEWNNLQERGGRFDPQEQREKELSHGSSNLSNDNLTHTPGITLPAVSFCVRMCTYHLFSVYVCVPISAYVYVYLSVRMLYE